MNTGLDGTLRLPAQGDAPSLDVWVVRLLVALSFCFSLLPPGLDFSRFEDAGEVSLATGSLAMQVQFGSLYLLGAWMVWRHRGWSLMRLQGMNPLLLALLAYCAVTLLWSPYPVVTLKKVIQFAGFMIVGMAIAPPVGGAHQLLRTLAGTLTALLVLSAVVVVVNPTLGIDRELGNAWRGAMSQKNTLGMIAAISLLLWLREALVGGWLPRGACVAAAVLSLGMLVMAKSSTSILVTGLGATVYLMLRRRYLTVRRPWWVLIFATAVLLGLGVHLFHTVTGRLPTWDDIAGSIGLIFNKQSDLTGRTAIWELVMLEVQRHPFFGLGYGSFWLGEGSPSQYIIDALYWIPLQAHNGYLDLLNELGVVGLLLAVGVFGWHAAQLGRLLSFDREEGALFSALFAILLVSNITESEMFRGTLFHTILFLYSSVIVSSRLVVARSSAAAVEDRP